MATEAAIEVSHLKKSYRTGLFRRRFEALKEVSLRVDRGQIFGLLGPNGAGKTTLIKVLLGIVRKSGGSASLLGRPAGDRASRLRVGYLPENLRLASHHTANTALEYFGRLSGLSVAEVRARRAELLESVGLADRAKESVKKYSKGMVQRLGLAQALLHKPELLILDEPTDGLDPLGRSHVRNILRQLSGEGVTVFLNSHLLQEVEMICEHVAILHRGELRAMGSVAELAAVQDSGVELQMTVSGDEEVVRRALGERGVSQWNGEGDSCHRISLRLRDQDAVDACVDDMRREGVSVIDLSRRKITLEDAFLNLIAEPAELVQ